MHGQNSPNFRQKLLVEWDRGVIYCGKSHSPTSKIVDYDGEPVEETFFDRELHRITKINDMFKIEINIHTGPRRRAAGKK